jgi:hypothetical protein
MEILDEDASADQNESRLLEDRLEDSLGDVFDDETPEGFRRGHPLDGPTRANLFLPAMVSAEKIHRMLREGKNVDLLKKVSEFVEQGYPFSKRLCVELIRFIRPLVPGYPNPIIKQDISPLGPLLEHMWDFAMQTRDKGLIDDVGSSLYRWYEHHRYYQKARRVLSKLITLFRNGKDRRNEATMINNFAFEYLLEGRWRPGIPLFEKAAKMFKDQNDKFEHANARANYWTCRFECDEFKDVEKSEKELKAIQKILGRHGDWRDRKPLVLLARIEEQRGHLNSAIRLVERGISACENSNSRYPELDGKYLKHLKRKRDQENQLRNRDAL